MTSYTSDNNYGGGIGGTIAGIGFVVMLVLGVIVLGLYGCPQYNVYEQRLSGQAELAKAQSNRQVSVAEAAAREEAAKHLAAADTIRAHGVATSNQIIGQSLRQNELYLTWLQIEALKETKDQIIYVPTEASLPILEGTRLLKREPEKQ